MEGTSGTTSTSQVQQAPQGREQQQQARDGQNKPQFSAKTQQSPKQNNSRGKDVNPFSESVDSVEEETVSSFRNARDEGESQEENTDEDSPEAKEGQLHKVKISGREIEVPYNQLLKLASQGGRMYQAMEEAASLRKESQKYGQVFERISKDPESFLELGRMLGHDIDALAHKKVMDKLQYELMDENERRLHDLENENKRYRETETQRQKREKEAQIAAATQKAVESTQNEVIEYFNSLGGKRDLQDMAATLEVVLESYNGDSRMSVAKAHKIAQSRLKNLVISKLESFSEDELRSLPASAREKIRQMELKAFKNNRQSAPAERKENPVPRKELSSNKSMTFDEYFDEFIPKKLGFKS